MEKKILWISSQRQAPDQVRDDGVPA
ncbi:uncharacterized protein METZ01_LOCUS482707 [marine metagenome]|uniref:Uncharacterized protein n=1 Tax=marine metagenome TaxID=408172 RepID=A0A383CCQ7_9ZZZZ